jgi:FG-GAP repeat
MSILFQNLLLNISLYLEPRNPVSGGRFGAAVACMGDVDEDSYSDVAVSAPYSAMADGQGVVYIYYGGPNGLQAARQPQAIWAKGVNGLGLLRSAS